MDKLIFEILRKEVLLIGKAKNGILSMFVLMVSLVFIFHYSEEKTSLMDMNSLLGLKWAIMFMVSFVLIGQSAWEERESGALRINQIYLSGSVFFLCKSFVLFLAISLVAILEILMFSFFFESFNLDFKFFFGNIVFFGLGIFSLSLLGVSLSIVSFATRLKEMVLPLLLIPFSIPILLFGMEAERKFIFQKGDTVFSAIIMVSLVFLYSALGLLLQEFSVEN
ncbi:MAG: heme exporter protein CcmB [Leptospiraceae bacterium]|nr:heme exporter protein CcmB [Leptospiraceae bacterium]